MSKEAIYLKGAPSVTVAPAMSPNSSPDAIGWELLKESNDVKSLRRFIEQFPTSRRRSEVLARISMLESPRVTKVAPTILSPTETLINHWVLGVKIQDFDEDIAASLGVENVKGALVNEVTVGGLAAASGLKAQDLIMSVDSAAIANSREFARKIAEFAPNTVVELKVLRAGKEEAVKAKLRRIPSANDEVVKVEPENAKTPQLGSLGMAFLNALLGQKSASKGLLIAKVSNDSDAAIKGLKFGDIVFEINSQPVASAADIEAAVQKARDFGRPSVLMTVESPGQLRRVVSVKMVTK